MKYLPNKSEYSNFVDYSGYESQDKIATKFQLSISKIMPAIKKIVACIGDVGKKDLNPHSFVSPVAD